MNVQIKYAIRTDVYIHIVLLRTAVVGRLFLGKLPVAHLLEDNRRRRGAGPRSKYLGQVPVHDVLCSSAMVEF